jgi:hypothetical protein
MKGTLAYYYYSNADIYSNMILTAASPNGIKVTTRRETVIVVACLCLWRMSLGCSVFLCTLLYIIFVFVLDCLFFGLFGLRLNFAFII